MIGLENEAWKPEALERSQMDWADPVCHCLLDSSPAIFVETSRAFAAHWLYQVNCYGRDCEAESLSEVIKLWLASGLT